MPSSFPSHFAAFAQRSPAFALGATQGFGAFAADGRGRRTPWRSRYEEIRLSAADQEFFMTYPEPLYFFLEMEPDDALARAYAPGLALICDLNLNLDLRLAVRQPACLPILSSLCAPDDYQADAGCHVYAWDADWRLAFHWTPLQEAAAGFDAQPDAGYDDLRLQLNSAGNRPIAREVRSHLESLLPAEAE